MIPPHRVLAPIDFSDASRVALMFAARLTQHCGGELHVLYAQDSLLAVAATHHGIDLSKDTRDELQAFVDASSPAAECNPRQHIEEGPAGDVIRNVASRERADVIVMGSHGMTGAARLVFGSTTESVLRRADRSVLVVPPTWTPPQPDVLDLRGTGPVIAAVDFSDASTAAAAAAGSLARLFKTSIELIHVVPAPAAPARLRAHADAAVAERVEAARREREVIAKGGLHFGAPVQVRVEVGSVPQELANATAPAPWRQPILVLGRRPEGATGAVPGAIAYRVLTLAQVPVLMYLPG